MTTPGASGPSMTVSRKMRFLAFSFDNFGVRKPCFHATSHLKNEAQYFSRKR